MSDDGSYELEAVELMTLSDVYRVTFFPPAGITSGESQGHQRNKVPTSRGLFLLAGL